MTGRAPRRVFDSGGRLAAIGLLVVVACSLAPGLGWGAPAGAVGDSGLSTLIIANPIGRWQVEPQSSLNAIASYLDSLEADSIVAKGANAANAVQGWRSPSNHSSYVVVALVALSGSVGSASVSPATSQQEAVAALASLCAGVASQKTVHTSTVAGVPGSHTLTCTEPNGGDQPYAAALARSNVLALVISTATSITAAQMDTIVTSEYAALPEAGFVVPGRGSNGSSTLGEVLIGLVVLVLVGAALWWVVQRANREAMVAPVTEPEVRRGVVQRPGSLSGGVAPPPNHGAVGPRAAPRPTPRPRP